MAFTRTSSGISNYSAFFGSEITVFVEGKNSAESNQDNVGRPIQTADELFHHSIFAHYSKLKKVKIKSVGCKNDLSAYADKILLNSLENCAVVFDSDYEGVLSSWTTTPKIMRTCGYSWENDIWSPEVCEAVISLFSGGRKWDRNFVRNTLSFTSNRLKRISRIEAVCRCYGRNLIIPNGNSVGVKINPHSKFLVDFKEASRLLGKVKSYMREFKDSSFNSRLSRMLRKTPAASLIRGHLWEAACMTIITAVLKNIGAGKNFSAENLRNVALGVFTQDPQNYLSAHAKKHYKNQIALSGL